MKKKILTGLIGCMLTFSLVACDNNELHVNVENEETLNNATLGKNSLLEIGAGLYYDSATRIVYWWNGYFSSTKWDTAPTPYYAPNGLPYKYNPKTNTFEEIKIQLNQ